MRKTPMNWKRGSLAYGDNVQTKSWSVSVGTIALAPSASQLKKEDLHLQSSLATNDYLKTKSLVKPTPNEPDDVLPTGFERSCSPSSSTLNKKRIPIISIDPGFTPPQFSLNPNWLVAAGEDSQERLSQRNAESKVQEAIYCHPSSIPANPCVSREVQCEGYDDSLTPIIPIEEIEIDHSSQQILEKMQLPVNPSSSMLQQQTIPSSAKFPQTDCSVNNAGADNNGNTPCRGTDAIPTVLPKRGEFASMIDTDLLLKILSNPKMMDALVNNPYYSSSVRDPVDVQPPLNELTQSCGAAEPPPMKQEDYYKNLIRQHGGEMIGQITTRYLNNHNIPNKEQNLTLNDNPHKSKKQCRFFNTKNGCRNGVSCQFLHEAKQPFQHNSTYPPAVEVRSAKRLKLVERLRECGGSLSTDCRSGSTKFGMQTLK